MTVRQLTQTLISQSHLTITAVLVWLTSASVTLAQVRPNPMGTRDAEIMSGRQWAGYFIGGFLLLIVLVILRYNQQQKQKEKKLAAKHRRQMEKLKEERRMAAQRRPPQ